jgi:FixJ family two-component response regulator
MPVILVTQEAEIRRILVGSQPASVKSYLEKPFTKLGLVEWLKVKAPRSSPNTTNNKKKTKKS